VIFGLGLWGVQVKVGKQKKKKKTEKRTINNGRFEQSTCSAHPWIADGHGGGKSFLFQGALSKWKMYNNFFFFFFLSLTFFFFRIYIESIELKATKKNSSNPKYFSSKSC
jgi:hypothetical protein